MKNAKDVFNIYASLRQTKSFEQLCEDMILKVWPVQVRKKKTWKVGKDRKRSHKKCIFHVCVRQPLNQTLQMFPLANFI